MIGLSLVVIVAWTGLGFVAVAVGVASVWNLLALARLARLGRGPVDPWAAIAWVLSIVVALSGPAALPGGALVAVLAERARRDAVDPRSALVARTALVNGAALVVGGAGQLVALLLLSGFS